MTPSEHGLELTYSTWVICPRLAIGVAAYRKKDLPPSELGRDKVNVLLAGDLSELGYRLAEQEKD